MTAHTLNFHLIRAAPDLLDLAKNIAALHDDYLTYNSVLSHAVRKWREQARTAIAKAEGKS
jgi:hypothetical protein